MKNKNKIKIIDFNGFSMYPFLKPKDRLITGIIHPEELQIGDIVISRGKGEEYIAHRLVKKINNGTGVLKGDSILSSDQRLVNLNKNVRIVTVILRGKRFISITEGIYSRLRAIYAFLSLRNLTAGAIRLRIKQYLNGLSRVKKPCRWENEGKIVSRLLKGESPEIVRELNLDKLKKISYREGVYGLVYQYVKKTYFHKGVYQDLEKAYNANIARNMKIISVLKNLEQILDHVKIEVMTLKGSSLLDNVYQDIGLRPMGDIDLMIRPDNREKFEELLFKKGYKREKQRPHIFIKDGISIDVHVHALNTDRIANRRFLFIRGMSPVWQNSRPLRNGFKWLKRPDDVDNIILLSLHMIKHSFEKLIWLYDVLLIVRSYDGDIWIDLKERSSFFKTDRQVKYTIYLLDRLFDLVPPEVKGKKIKSVNKIEAAILEERVKNGPLEKSGVLLNLFCVNGFKQKVSFLYETILPGKDIYYQEFNKLYGKDRVVFSCNRFLDSVRISVKQVYVILVFYLKSVFI